VTLWISSSGFVSVGNSNSVLLSVEASFVCALIEPILHEIRIAKTRVMFRVDGIDNFIVVVIFQRTRFEHPSNWIMRSQFISKLFFRLSI